ncbi:MAG: DNA primase, partial [Gammaproteobacteria bacterium]|nr:DNA primase [Gammaproteobacteria bacterium]
MSGRIPKQFIDNLISRVDIVDLIDKRIPLKKAGRDYQACCPFHNEKTPSFTVSQDKQFYHCFGCGAHGTAIGFLMDYAHMDFVDAIHELAGHLGLQVPTESGSSHQGPDLTPLYRILEDAADYYRLQLREHPGAPRAVTYLKDRGLSGEIAARFGIGYAPPGWDNILKSMGSDEDRIQALSQTGMLIEKESDRRYDRFRDRIMFPILDRRGRTVGFGGRILDEGTPKYLNSPETPVFHKGREVYGQCQVREVQSNPTQLLVVEGYMDVVALAQFGIHYSVATLGTAATPEHLTQLFRIAPRIIFCFDGDEAGRKAAWRALETSLPLLSEGHQALFLFLPEGDDPDTMIRRLGQEEFEHRVDRATSLSSYFFNQLTQQVDMANLDGRARLVELARPYFNKIPPGAFRQLLTQRLGELSNIKPEDLSPLLKSKSPSPPVRAIVRRDGARPPSLMRRTITLLLHHPELAKL